MTEIIKIHEGAKHPLMDFFYIFSIVKNAPNKGRYILFFVP